MISNIIRQSNVASILRKHHHDFETLISYATNTTLKYTHTRTHAHSQTDASASLTHLEHKGPLDNAASDAKHAGEEPREEADGGIPQRVHGIPLNVPLDVLVAQLGLQNPPLHQVLPHPATRVVV